jgi:hypothetical protein
MPGTVIAVHGTYFETKQPFGDLWLCVLLSVSSDTLRVWWVKPEVEASPFIGELQPLMLEKSKTRYEGTVAIKSFIAAFPKARLDPVNKGKVTGQLGVVDWDKALKKLSRKRDREARENAKELLRLKTERSRVKEARRKFRDMELKRREEFDAEYYARVLPGASEQPGEGIGKRRRSS